MFGLIKVYVSCQLLYLLDFVIVLNFYSYNMGPANCVVVGCKNSTYQLKKWRASLCQAEDHKLKEA